jgi:hypothetical protein
MEHKETGILRRIVAWLNRMVPVTELLTVVLEE